MSHTLPLVFFIHSLIPPATAWVREALHFCYTDGYSLELLAFGLTPLLLSVHVGSPLSTVSRLTALGTRHKFSTTGSFSSLPMPGSETLLQAS